MEKSTKKSEKLIKKLGIGSLESNESSKPEKSIIKPLESQRNYNPNTILGQILIGMLPAEWGRITLPERYVGDFQNKTERRYHQRRMIVLKQFVYT